ncbi:Hypothetical protein I595_1366 [Croceitalea dokdonensis DOKDO 023]|uniref:Uncharacterized protein n=1 Tax=Croceitalea dokdonensis DOKDO 023 TaxID=1300341 RepID=A0A0P7AXZ5_9FLAO|nr:Hypothetical protein I595_1366 [Croceitalea dokdonensis DOKDO 023]
MLFFGLRNVWLLAIKGLPDLYFLFDLLRNFIILLAIVG